jgi:hypothetical protein
MARLPGVEFEYDSQGKTKRVVFDMKYHSLFVENYLDHLRIKKAMAGGRFTPWEEVKSRIQKKWDIDDCGNKML